MAVSRRRAPPEHSNRKFDIIGFAIVLASFGKSGRGIWPSAEKVAERGGQSVANVKRLRKLVVRLGLFRKTGGHHGRIEDLEIDIPSKAPVKAHDDPWAGMAPANFGDPDDVIGSRVIRRDTKASDQNESLSDHPWKLSDHG